MKSRWIFRFLKSHSKVLVVAVLPIKEYYYREHKIYKLEIHIYSHFYLLKFLFFSLFIIGFSLRLHQLKSQWCWRWITRLCRWLLTLNEMQQKLLLLFSYTQHLPSIIPPLWSNFESDPGFSLHHTGIFLHSNR